MAKTKKGLSLVLAVVMLFSMFAIGSFAAEAQTADFAVTTDAAGALKAGDTVTVTVSLTTNYFVGPLAVPVTYDAAAFDLVAGSLTISNIFGDGTTETVSSTPDGSVYVVISPKTSGTPTTEVANNLELFTFRLTAADVNGEFPIAITDDQKSAEKPGGKWYCGAFDGEDPKTAKLTTVGQTFTKTDATVTVGSTMQPADLALTDKGTTDGVVIDTRFTFGGQYDGVVYGFNHAAFATFRNTTYLKNSLQATNGGSLVYARSIGTVGYGTGTTVTVKNADGSDADKVYVVVIFGDVNCDGVININDATACKAYANSPATLTDKVVRMAANCQNIKNANMMYNVNMNDAVAAKAYANNAAAKVSQATLAATVKGLASINANYK